MCVEAIYVGGVRRRRGKARARARAHVRAMPSFLDAAAARGSSGVGYMNNGWMCGWMDEYIHSFTRSLSRRPESQMLETNE